VFSPNPLSFRPIPGLLASEEGFALIIHKGYEEHEAGLPHFGSEPAWDPLRDDPRFHDLLRRMNLEP
jgi:hypothetical protein